MVRKGSIIWTPLIVPITLFVERLSWTGWNVTQVYQCAPKAAGNVFINSVLLQR